MNATTIRTDRPAAPAWRIRPAIECPRPAPPMQATVGVVGISASLVTLGFAVSRAMALLAEVAMDAPGAASGCAVVGGVVLGTGLAAHVLHRRLAKRLAAAPGATRYTYSPQARRLMTAGLSTAYVTAGLLALASVNGPGAARGLATLLSY